VRRRGVREEGETRGKDEGDHGRREEEGQADGGDGRGMGRRCDRSINGNSANQK
jgi:hypothetical protein